jgi:hypothetical protein
MHGSMGGGRKPVTVGHAARHQAPLAYPTTLQPGPEAVWLLLCSELHEPLTSSGPCGNSPDVICLSAVARRGVAP